MARTVYAAMISANAVKAIAARRPICFRLRIIALAADHFRQLARRPQAELTEEFPAADDSPDVEASLHLNTD